MQNLPCGEFVSSALVLYGTLQSNRTQYQSIERMPMQSAKPSRSAKPSSAKLPSAKPSSAKIIRSAKPVRRARRNGQHPPAAGAGRPEAVDQRRERIVRMTAPLFLKKGYDNVSIDEIIGIVGGSKATIYAWFGGKEGLFEAVVRQKCEDVTLAIAVDTKGSLEAQLTHIGHSFLATVLSPPILEFHRLMVSIGRTFPAAGRLFFESGPVSAYSIVAAWIARHQHDGRIADE